MGRRRILLSAIGTENGSKERLVSCIDDIKPDASILFFSERSHHMYSEDLKRELSNHDVKITTFSDENDIDHMCSSIRESLMDCKHDDEYYFDISSGNRPMAVALSLVSSLLKHSHLIHMPYESDAQGNEKTENGDIRQTIPSPISSFDILMEWVMRLARKHDYVGATDIIDAVEEFHRDDEHFHDLRAKLWFFRHWNESNYHDALFVLRQYKVEKSKPIAEGYDSFLRAVIRDLDDERGAKNVAIVDTYQNARRCYIGGRYDECMDRLEKTIELIIEGGANSLGFSHGKIDAKDEMFNNCERERLAKWTGRSVVLDKDVIGLSKSRRIKVISWKDQKFEEIDALYKIFSDSHGYINEPLFYCGASNDKCDRVKQSLNVVEKMIENIIPHRESKRLTEFSYFYFDPEIFAK